MTSWQLQEAKARLSELVKKATTEGPQEITVHGKPTVVVMSVEEFERRVVPAPKKPSLIDLFLSSPFKGADLDIERDKSPAREVPDLGEDA